MCGIKPHNSAKSDNNCSKMLNLHFLCKICPFCITISKQYELLGITKSLQVNVKEFFFLRYFSLQQNFCNERESNKL